MATQITYKFSCYPTGPTVNAAALSTRLAAVPLDNDLLQFDGLRVISDATNIVASFVTRTIVLGMTPAGAGTVQANLDTSTTPSAILSYTVETTGNLYVRPPIVTIADTPPGIGSGASAYATLGVFGTALGGAEVNPYSAATTVTASGGQLAPGGTQATFTVTLLGGAISAVNIVTNGGPYNVPPVLTIADPGGGSGQTVVAQLGLSGIIATAPGKSYTNPVVTLLPYFKSLNPDAAGALTQAESVQSWMQSVIQRAMNVSIVPSLGVVA